MRSFKEHQYWLENEYDWGGHTYFDHIMGLAEYYVKKFDDSIRGGGGPIDLNDVDIAAITNILLFVTHHLPDVAGDKLHEPPYNLVYDGPTTCTGMIKLTS